MSLIALYIVSATNLGPTIRTVPPKTQIFCTAYEYKGKADLSKGIQTEIGGNHTLFRDNTLQ